MPAHRIFLVACAAHVAQHFDEEWRTRGVLGNDNADLVAWRLQGEELRLGASQLAERLKGFAAAEHIGITGKRTAPGRESILVIERPQVYGLTPDKEQGSVVARMLAKSAGDRGEASGGCGMGLVEVNQSDPLMHRYD